MTKPESIKIDDVEYVRADKLSVKADLLDGMKYVICRTHSNDVFAGYLESRNGQEVVMRNARRIFYWEGSSNLSLMAVDGASNIWNCKIHCAVDRIELLQAIEILDCTKKAQESIVSVAIWQQY